MHIDGLVSSFKPDIAFRFSLGLSAASPRISAFINQSAAALLVGRPAVAAAASCTSEASDLFDEFLDFTQTPQGMLVVAGAASLLTQYRTRIVSYGAVLFFALCVFCSKMPLSLPSRIDQSALRYVYERASYTKSAKIHRFKNQLIEHTKGNLDQLVPHTAYVHFVAHASECGWNSFDGHTDSMPRKILGSNCPNKRNERLLPCDRRQRVWKAGSQTVKTGWTRLLGQMAWNLVRTRCGSALSRIFELLLRSWTERLLLCPLRQSLERLREVHSTRWSAQLSHTLLLYIVLNPH